MVLLINLSIFFVVGKTYLPCEMDEFAVDHDKLRRFDVISTLDGSRFGVLEAIIESRKGIAKKMRSVIPSEGTEKAYQEVIDHLDSQIKTILGLK